MQILLSLFALLASISASALYTEIGISYNYKKSTYNSNNNTEQQSTTGSISFYAWEQIGIELSYTNGLYVQKSKDSSRDTSLVRTTTQFSDIYGFDLIYVIGGKDSKFQPYVKGGGAYITKKQVVQDEGQPAGEVIPPISWAPSYGAGLKFFLTQSLAIRAGYDVLHTPVDGNITVDDVAGRLGLSWVF